jgi:hypothetical protein
MSSLGRAALFLALVVGLGGVVFFASRPDPRPARVVRSEPRAVVTAPSTPASESLPALASASARVESLPSSLATQPPTPDALVASVHALEDSNPERALELARRGQELWPAGPHAAEFAAAEVKCLYRLGRPSEGRGAAEAMVNKYPTSPWALEVERQTGAHPYVNH